VAQRMATSRPKVDVYPHSSYVNTQGGPSRRHADQSPQGKMQRMKHRFEMNGTIRSVEAVLLVHLHGHPHLLLLETTIGTNVLYRLPGGKLQREEDEVECLKRKLLKKVFGSVEPDAPQPFRVGEQLAQWYRPNFDPLMYPYKPAHITHEKETRSIFLVHLDAECTMAIPSEYSLVAVPLFEVFDNAARFGAVIAGIPHVLSRLHINLC
jgi:cleavage and polyadenylation specificity factor subunit 5